MLSGYTEKHLYTQLDFWTGVFIIKIIYIFEFCPPPFPKWYFFPKFSEHFLCSPFFSPPITPYIRVFSPTNQKLIFMPPGGGGNMKICTPVFGSSSVWDRSIIWDRTIIIFLGQKYTSDKAPISDRYMHIRDSTNKILIISPISIFPFR